MFVELAIWSPMFDWSNSHIYAVSPHLLNASSQDFLEQFGDNRPLLLHFASATGVSWISARITLELYAIDILHKFGRRSPQVSTTCLRDLKSAFSIFWLSSIFWAQNFWLLFAFHHMSVQTLQNILTVSQSEIGSNHSLHCHNKMQKLGGTARGQRHKCTP